MKLSAKQDVEFEALPLRLAYSFLTSNGLAKEANEIRSSQERLGSYTTTLKRAKIMALLKSSNLLSQFIEKNWPFGSSAGGKKKIAMYDNLYVKYKKAAGTSDPTESSEIEDEDGNGKFALEEQLRDYLAENLHLLEAGLTLWPVDDGDAVEFQVDVEGPSRRIDILARDKNKLPVIIELKVSRGHEKTIGQTLYYRARIKKRLEAQKVRIFIVAAEISPALRCAASEVPDITLFDYSLAVTVKIVPTVGQ